MYKIDAEKLFKDFYRLYKWYRSLSEYQMNINNMGVGGESIILFCGLNINENLIIIFM